MWPIRKPQRVTDKEVDANLVKADRARLDMDRMHKRLEKAVEGLMATAQKEIKND